MDVDLRLVVAAGAAVTAILWAIAILSHRVDRRVTLRGFRNGAIVATGIFLVIAVIVTLALNGQQFMIDPIDLGFAAVLGIFVGLVIALSYLWLGGLLIAIGQIFRAKPVWTTIGAWAAVPVIVISLGFGYVSFRSVQQEGSAPTAYRGSVALELTGAKLGPLSVAGNGQCQYDGTGALRLRAGGGVGGTTIATPDGRQVYVQFDLDSFTTAPSIDVVIGGVEAAPGKGWEPGPATIAVTQGSGTQSGSATLKDLVPMDQEGEPDATERWSGKVSWSCTSQN